MNLLPEPKEKEMRMTNANRNTTDNNGHTAAYNQNNIIRNTKLKDSGAKLIFDNHTLCAQFLRGYTDVELLKNVQADDIEDITERFLWLWQEGRDSDSVKKIHLNGFSGTDTLYLIALIEHQSSVDHDMAFRILRYIVQILTDYAEEQEKKQKGITKTAGFLYPPILPIVFFDGTGNWTAPPNFKDKVHLSNVLGEFVPDFRQLKEIPEEYFENISRNSPESVLKLIGKLITVLLLRLNVPKDEVAQLTDQIERRNFTMLFENFEAYDVQETRRISKAEYIIDLLEDIGTIPEDLKDRIMQEHNLETLRKWHKTAARADSIDAFIQKMNF